MKRIINAHDLEGQELTTSEGVFVVTSYDCYHNWFEVVEVDTVNRYRWTVPEMKHALHEHDGLNHKIVF